MKRIKTVCIVGAGIMGRQIALNAAVHGFNVYLTDTVAKTLDEAKSWSQEFLTNSVHKGKMTQDDKSSSLERLSFEADLATACRDTDLVIEAIIEDESIKRTLLAKLSSLTREDTILSSNSSYIPSSKYIDVVKNPARLANVHFFNPAMIMKLVELVRGPHTSDETVEALKDYVTGIGKIYILVNKEIEGFVVNRLLRAVQDEAYFLLENGIATFEDIDKGAELGLNYPMGPFRLLDLTGLDINYYNRSRKYELTKDPKDKPPASLLERFKRGDYGKKTGKGWYSYE